LGPGHSPPTNIFWCGWNLKSRSRDTAFTCIMIRIGRAAYRYGVSQK